MTLALMASALAARRAGQCTLNCQRLGSWDCVLETKGCLKVDDCGMGLRALSCLGLDVCVRLVILSRMEQYGQTSTVKSPGLVHWKLC